MSTSSPARPGPRPWRRIWPILLASLVGLFFALLGYGNQLGEDGAPGPALDWRLPVDVFAGLGALVLLYWRHRFPRTVLVLVNVASGLSMFASGAWTLAVVSVAKRRKVAEAAFSLVLSMLSARANSMVYPEVNQSTPWWVVDVFSLLVTGCLLGFGWYQGARADLVESLRLRAETAEREQSLRVASALSAEREAIAREMHDVLAHRISLIAMHAGALSYRDDLTAEQTRETAGLIAGTASQALDELRGVLGVLRAGDAAFVAGAPAAPQPTLGALPDIVEEARQAGTTVTVDDELRAELPPDLGRHAFRIVQEGLTNARKHSPGAGVRVRLSGRPGAMAVVEVVNAAAYPRLGAPAPEGAGLGLIGLSERAALIGGGLTHGRTSDGGFALKVWFPWPARRPAGRPVGRPAERPTGRSA